MSDLWNYDDDSEDEVDQPSKVPRISKDSSPHNQQQPLPGPPIITAPALKLLDDDDDADDGSDGLEIVEDKPAATSISVGIDKEVEVTAAQPQIPQPLATSAPPALDEETRTLLANIHSGLNAFRSGSDVHIATDIYTGGHPVLPRTVRRPLTLSHNITSAVKHDPPQPQEAAPPSTASPPTEPSAPEADKVKLVFRTRCGSTEQPQVPVRIAPSEGLGKAFALFRKHAVDKGWATSDSTFKFVFDGDALTDTQTIEDLELEDGDIIDVKIK